MSTFVAAKVVASLPDPVTPNTVYFVRAGAGFDLYCSDSTGSIAHKINDVTVPATGEESPSFTYASGNVTRIDYASGDYKLLTWTDGVLTRVDFLRAGQTTVRKDFTYNPDGTLASIAQSEVAP